MVLKKKIYKINERTLVTGGGVTKTQAKRAFLSGMSKGFKKKVRVVFVKKGGVVI